MQIASAGQAEAVALVLNQHCRHTSFLALWLAYRDRDAEGTSDPSSLVPLVAAACQADYSKRTNPEYQALVRELLGQYTYRLDTNFAKMDRIVHPEIEAFKNQIYNTQLHGKTIGAWNRLLSQGSEDVIRQELAERLQITDAGPPVVE